MKQLVSIIILALACTLSSFKPNNTSNLYPKIENYFNSLDLSKKNEANKDVLFKLKDNIEFSQIDYRHNYLLTGNNSDAAAFAHIILHSWLKEKKFKKVDLVACAPVQSISEAGIQTLKEIGYGVEFNDGVYTVQFSDKEKPLKLNLYSCASKEATETKYMTLQVSPAGSGSDSETVLLYSSASAKEMFQSIATDLYSMIQELKK